MGRADGSVVKASATEADHPSPVPVNPHGAGKGLTSKVVFLSMTSASWHKWACMTHRDKQIKQTEIRKIEH